MGEERALYLILHASIESISLLGAEVGVVVVAGEAAQEAHHLLHTRGRLAPLLGVHAGEVVSPLPHASSYDDPSLAPGLRYLPQSICRCKKLRQSGEESSAAL